MQLFLSARHCFENAYVPAQVKSQILVPVVLMLVLALSRWPGLMPPSFSAIYAMAFCAGVFFPRKMAWWLPLATFAVTDLALNCYYQSQGWETFTIPTLLYMMGNYVGYIALIFLGKQFKPKASFVSLLGGGVLGALLFYFVTNTLSWLINPFKNPEYTRDLAGWMWALTKGTTGWPETWTFFRNTLMSGGLFTGLFVAAMKLNEAPEESEEKDEETEAAPSDQPEDAKA